MIETSERAEILFLEVCKLINNNSNKKEFEIASFEDFVEAEGNNDFINKNLFSDNDSDQDSDWEDINQNLTIYQEQDVSSDINNKEPMDIDENQPRSGKCRNLQVIATISTIEYVRIKPLKILKHDLCIPSQQ